MISTLISAFIFGLIGGAIPGPVLTATFTEILQKGFVKSLRIVFQAMLTESIVATICIVVFSSIDFPEAIFRILSILGALILIWLATSLWKIGKFDTKSQIHFSFWKISAMILANGVLWTFWITVITPKAIELKSQVNFGHFFYLITVELGWLVSTVLIAFLFSRFRGILSKPKVIPYIFKFFALTFVYFALDMVYKTVLYFGTVL